MSAVTATSAAERQALETKVTMTALRKQITPSMIHPIDKEKHIMKGDVVKQISNNLTERQTRVHKEPKGRNVSGRPWKVRTQKRASSLMKTKANNQVKSWEERQAEKRKRQEAKELQKEMLDEKRQKIEAKKERKLEQEKRRAENELKALEASKGIQKLNAKKVGVTLKALSKKQLRQIKKSRVNTRTGVVEYVPAYAKWCRHVLVPTWLHSIGCHMVWYTVLPAWCNVSLLSMKGSGHRLGRGM